MPPFGASQYPQQQYPQQGNPQQPYPQQQYPQQGNPQQPYPQGYPQQQYPQQQSYPQQWVGSQQWAGSRPPSASRGSGAKVAIIAVLAAVVVAAVVGGVVLVRGSQHTSPTAAAAAQTSTASAGDGAAAPSATAGDLSSSCDPAASTSTEPVGYHACGAAARNVGVPVFSAATADRTYTVTMKTNRGDIVFTADGSAAPYTVESFVFLVEKKYFDDTPCHRLTISGIFVLQCGDPTGTGTGGPGYAFQDENLASLGTPDSSGSVTYKAGTVAMANAGPDTNGSQFFLVYRDSTIAPSYTPFGTITQGLGIIQQIAAAGTNNANGAGDGAPLESVQIESVTVR